MESSVKSNQVAPMDSPPENPEDQQEQIGNPTQKPSNNSEQPPQEHSGYPEQTPHGQFGNPRQPPQGQFGNPGQPPQGQFGNPGQPPYGQYGNPGQPPQFVMSNPNNNYAYAPYPQPAMNSFYPSVYYPPMQPNVVVLGQQNTGVVRPFLSFIGNFILSCIVLWCCGFLFGLIAFILAVVGYNTSESDDASYAVRRQLYWASYGVAIAGLVIGVIIYIAVIVTRIVL